MNFSKPSILLAALLLCVPSGFGQSYLNPGNLIVNLDVTPTLISMTDSTGGSLTSGTGSMSLTYTDPEFSGANMYNELNAVIFPYQPATGNYWAALVNAGPGGGGWLSVTLEQRSANGETGSAAGGFSPGFWEDWSETVEAMALGSYSPGWQSFGPFFIEGDIPTFQNGREVADQNFEVNVDLNINFAPVPEASTLLAGALPVIVFALQIIRSARNLTKTP